MPFGSLALIQPVADDRITPVFTMLAPSLTNPYFQRLPQIQAVLSTGFGLIDPQTIHAAINGVDFTSLLQLSTIDGGRSYSISGDFNVPPLKDGAYTFSLVGGDVSGNMATTLTFPFYVDTIAPRLILSQADNQHVSSPNFPLNIMVIDASPTTTSVIQNGILIYQGPDKYIPLNTTLKVGLNVFQVSSQDAAGNVSASTYLSHICYKLPAQGPISAASLNFEASGNQDFVLHGTLTKGLVLTGSETVTASMAGYAVKIPLSQFTKSGNIYSYIAPVGQPGVTQATIDLGAGTFFVQAVQVPIGHVDDPVPARFTLGAFDQCSMLQFDSSQIPWAFNIATNKQTPCLMLISPIADRGGGFTNQPTQIGFKVKINFPTGFVSKSLELVQIDDRFQIIGSPLCSFASSPDGSYGCTTILNESAPGMIRVAAQGMINSTATLSPSTVLIFRGQPTVDQVATEAAATAQISTLMGQVAASSSSAPLSTIKQAIVQGALGIPGVLGAGEVGNNVWIKTQLLVAPMSIYLDNPTSSAPTGCTPGSPGCSATPPAMCTDKNGATIPCPAPTPTPCGPNGGPGCAPAPDMCPGPNGTIIKCPVLAHSTSTEGRVRGNSLGSWVASLGARIFGALEHNSIAQTATPTGNSGSGAGSGGGTGPSGGSTGPSGGGTGPSGAGTGGCDPAFTPSCAQGSCNPSVGTCGQFQANPIPIWNPSASRIDDNHFLVWSSAVARNEAALTKIISLVQLFPTTASCEGQIVNTTPTEGSKAMLNTIASMPGNGAIFLEAHGSQKPVDEIKFIDPNTGNYFYPGLQQYPGMTTIGTFLTGETEEEADAERDKNGVAAWNQENNITGSLAEGKDPADDIYYAEVLPKFLDDQFKGQNFRNSVIYLAVCHSADNESLSNSFFKAGAGAVYGWYNSVTAPDAEQNGLEIFTNLLALQLNSKDAFENSATTGSTGVAGLSHESFSGYLRRMYAFPGSISDNVGYSMPQSLAVISASANPVHEAPGNPTIGTGDVISVATIGISGITYQPVQQSIQNITLKNTGCTFFVPDVSSASAGWRTGVSINAYDDFPVAATARPNFPNLGLSRGSVGNSIAPGHTATLKISVNASTVETESQVLQVIPLGIYLASLYGAPPNPADQSVMLNFERWASFHVMPADFGTFTFDPESMTPPSAPPTGKTFSVTNDSSVNSLNIQYLSNQSWISGGTVLNNNQTLLGSWYEAEPTGSWHSIPSGATAVSTLLIRDSQYFGVMSGTVTVRSGDIDPAAGPAPEVVVATATLNDPVPAADEASCTESYFYLFTPIDILDYPVSGPSGSASSGTQFSASAQFVADCTGVCTQTAVPATPNWTLPTITSTFAGYSAAGMIGLPGDYGHFTGQATVTTVCPPPSLPEITIFKESEYLPITFKPAPPCNQVIYTTCSAETSATNSTQVALPSPPSGGGP